jgi:hypothetical protein
MFTLTASVFNDLFEGHPLNLLFGIALLIGAMFSAFLLFFHEIGDLLGTLHFDLHLDHAMGGAHDVDAHNAHEATTVSTLAIASFISAFGGFGLIAVTLFDAGSVVSLIAALGGGLVIGIAAQLFFLYILSPTISSEIKQTRLIGMVAEIITPIPAKGVGQIAFVAKGSRITYSARATDEQSPVERGTPVRIERIVGGMAYVSPVE